MAGPWKECSKKKPCPICGSDHYCGYSTEDSVARCMKVAVAPVGWVKIKDDPKGGSTYRQEGSDERRQRTRPAQTVTVQIFHDETAEQIYRDTSTAQRAKLAAELGVSVMSLEALKVGWWASEGAWSFPERNAIGQVVGICRRTPGSSEKRVKGGHKRGAYIGLGTMPGIVLVVEGGSDTAACWTMGIPSLGRYNNHGIPDLTAAVLRDRDVIVVAEYDQKEDGRWPGRDAAVEHAQYLANAWNRPVRWALPPGGGVNKDIRTWFNNSQVDPEDHERCMIIGQTLIDSLQASSVTVDPVEVSKTVAGGRSVITNIDQAPDRKSSHYVNLPTIASSLAAATDRWPRRVAGELFAISKETIPGKLPCPSQIWYLNNVDALFAWLQTSCEVRWGTKDVGDPGGKGMRTPIRKREFFEFIKATADPQYQVIEHLPHHPRVTDAYYLPCELPTSDGTALAEFAARLNADTEIDRQLMVAAFLTLGWGGPPGKRPAFLFTTDHGQGVGKSTTAEMLAEPWGGFVTMDQNEEWAQLRGRLLDDQALTKRCIFVDNVTQFMSRSGLEAAITSPVIDGKRMYVGQSSRPNRMTIFMTANNASLGSDMAKRAVVIKVGPERHNPEFEAWREYFMRERKAALIADAIALLSSPPRCSIATVGRDRFAMWQDGVLSRLTDGAKLAEHIKAGRPAIDADLAKSEDTAEAIIRFIAAAGHDPNLGRYSIRVANMHELLVAAGVCRNKSSPMGTTTWLKGMLRSGPLMGRLDQDSDRNEGRSWLWTGVNPASVTAPKIHLEAPSGGWRSSGKVGNPEGGSHAESVDDLPI